MHEIALRVPNENTILNHSDLIEPDLALEHWLESLSKNQPLSGTSNLHNNFIVGGIKNRIKVWKQCTKSVVILYWISNGYKLLFKSPIVPKKYRNHSGIEKYLLSQS